ncbi:MAG: bifunctional glutamate N-acetyltransferase/amino-acid acetyltransferase ArgJ [Oscillospiraceae bacterium]
MNEIEGGVTAPKGFTAGGIHCGVKAGSSPDKNDLAMILSELPCRAAATYTTNRVKAAPLQVTRAHLQTGPIRGIIANSGNANACAPHSLEYAEKMCACAADATGLEPQEFLVASTGVIGQTINIAAIESGMPALAQSLTRAGSEAAAHAIMTTDTKKKEYAVTAVVGGVTVTLGAIAKGSGMIHPNMGTMLCFITTDCKISPQCLDRALHAVVPKTFNRVTVDGDTSTNDMCVILANGMAGNGEIVTEGTDFEAFSLALLELCRWMAIHIAADGEGASRLITCRVHGTDSEKKAEILSKSVVGSVLVKAAMFGADANWGRVLCAMGYAGVPFDPEAVDVAFSSSAGSVAVCRNGAAIPFSEEQAKEILTKDSVTIEVCLHEGKDEATCWGCDLTYKYVEINGDYRT